MKRIWLAALGCGILMAQDEVVFRSDTTLVRVDVQVLDRDNRAVSGLEREAFVLREQGQQRAIKNFGREELPIDLLFLIDVSGSMRTHVERMAAAARDALPAMHKDDRVAVMVFDRQSRLRMPLRNGSSEALREFDHLLRSETFNGGTDITRALLDGAQFMKRQGRKDARRAIVLLTDDQTEFDADEERVVRALNNADTVMSVLLVPNAIRSGGYPRGGGGYPQGGGRGYPGGGQRRGGGWGGIILGGPTIGGYPGGGYPGGGGGGRRGPVGGGPMGGGASRTHPAGSAQIAVDSGGDAMQSDEASALETTLQRLRQRYALYFNLPAGVEQGDSRNIEITLEDTVRRQHPGATLKYRRNYVAAASAGEGAPEKEEVLTPVPIRPKSEPTAEPTTSRRRAVDGSSSKGPGIVVH